MTISSVSSLFFAVVLLGFVVKNVDGVRGLSPAATAMVETEVTSWRKDPCEKYGAKRDPEDENWCACPQDRPRVTKECGIGDIPFSAFRRAYAKPGCRCVTEAERAELLRLPVAASALRFCEALVEHGDRAYNEAVGREAMGHEAMNAMPHEVSHGAMEDALKKTSPVICQHALTGTISKTEAQKAPWAKEASKISHKGSAEDDEDDEDRDEKYGRMQPVKESATTSREKELWEHALARVCKDECEDLLKMMKEEALDLAEDVISEQVPFAQTCAERVVKQVEAEVLGCCARSCGFNGQTCLLWPFFSEEEKVEWNVECCAEMSVLKNSSRERMCNSVLPDRLAIAASQYDLNEQAGTDIGKVLIGQNSSLVWTKKGAEQSKLGKEAGVHEGEEVSMDFLLANKDVGEEFLRRGFFREEPITKMLDEATSLMEGNFQDDTCNFGKLQQQCPKKFHETYMKTCKESWKVTQVSEESEDSEETNFRDLLLHEQEGHCNESDSQDFSTPEECEQLEVNSFGKVFLHYFKYNRENKVLPIKCFSVSKKQCKGPAKDDWWKRITSVSVQKLINEQDVNDYTDLVYLKVKADE